MAHPHTFGLCTGEITGKDERLKVHLADHRNSNKPLVIYASLVPEQERIYELIKDLGISVALINGSVSATKRAEIDTAFRAGRIQCVVASPQTAAVGFNWEHVDHIIFVSLDYMDSSFVQAYRRAIRGKRTTPLLITVLEYERSIDQRIFAIVDRKSRDANLVDGSREALTLSQGEAA